MIVLYSWLVWDVCFSFTKVLKFYGFYEHFFPIFVWNMGRSCPFSGIWEAEAWQMVSEHGLVGLRIVGGLDVLGSFGRALSDVPDQHETLWISRSVLGIF